MLDAAIGDTCIKHRLRARGYGEFLDIGIRDAAFEMADTDAGDVDWWDDHRCGNLGLVLAHMRVMRCR